MVSPIGPLLLTSDGAALTGVYMTDHEHGPVIGKDWVEDGTRAPLSEAARQLAAYFAGDRTEFDLPLAPAGTEFQKRVWDELTRIPYGLTVSYGEIAERIGNPKGVRAVGLANGRNPISIVVPCHRVIGANGKLVGYGGGLPRKEWLLAHEMGIRS
jgi:methylated-DNA-[protein]-cysteine S-methyltransferase